MPVIARTPHRNACRFCLLYDRLGRPRRRQIPRAAIAVKNRYRRRVYNSHDLGLWVDAAFSKLGHIAFQLPRAVRHHPAQIHLHQIAGDQRGIGLWHLNAAQHLGRKIAQLIGHNRPSTRPPVRAHPAPIPAMCVTPVHKFALLIAVRSHAFQKSRSAL